MMAHKFSHIKSLKALDKEITNAELRKEIIQKDFSSRIANVRKLLKPVSLTWQVVKMFTQRSGSKSPSGVLVKTVLEILTTAEASKYALKVLKKMFK